MTARHRILRLSGEPLSVPLREPFVIATATMDATRAVLLRVELERTADGRRAEGLGEAAALPPVTDEDQPDLLATVERLSAQWVGHAFDVPDEILDAPELSGRPVAASGVASALLDALARLEGVPLHAWLGGSGQLVPLRTDITLPIGEAEHVADLARDYHARGFGCFKVKVGRDAAADHRALAAIHRAVPDARYRLDANGGFEADTALRLIDRLASEGLDVELFEQPCARDDLDGMAAVTARSPVPVVADESVRSLADLERLADAGAAAAINLKLSKMAGPIAAHAIGTRARALGLRLMAGAMVETRLGLATMAHVVTALGGVDWLDLDTAFLLADDPFTGGYDAQGPDLRLLDGPGHTVAVG